MLPVPADTTRCPPRHARVAKVTRTAWERRMHLAVAHALDACAAPETQPQPGQQPCMRRTVVPAIRHHSAAAQYGLSGSASAPPARRAAWQRLGVRHQARVARCCRSAARSERRTCVHGHAHPTLNHITHPTTCRCCQAPAGLTQRGEGEQHRTAATTGTGTAAARSPAGRRDRAQLARAWARACWPPDRQTPRQTPRTRPSDPRDSARACSTSHCRPSRTPEPLSALAACTRCARPSRRSTPRRAARSAPAPAGAASALLATT